MCVSSAYWIAFGPHGPRSLPPPGENLYILKMVALSMGAALVLLWASRQLARPAPKTMNAQYQEMTNEYLRVSSPVFSSKSEHVATLVYLYEPSQNLLLIIRNIESKNRTHHRRLLRRLQRQRDGAKQAAQGWGSFR